VLFQVPTGQVTIENQKEAGMQYLAMLALLSLFVAVFDFMPKKGRS
jgi:hypothetical protein